MIDLLALGFLGPNIGKAARRELFRIDLAVDQPASAGEADAPEAARHGLLRHSIGDVQPGQRQTGLDEMQRLVDRVVGTNHEVGARRGEFPG